MTLSRISFLLSIFTLNDKFDYIRIFLLLFLLTFMIEKLLQNLIFWVLEIGPIYTQFHFSSQLIPFLENLALSGNLPKTSISNIYSTSNCSLLRFHSYKVLGLASDHKGLSLFQTFTGPLKIINRYVALRIFQCFFVVLI